MISNLLSTEPKPESEADCSRLRKLPKFSSRSPPRPPLGMKRTPLLLSWGHLLFDDLSLAHRLQKKPISSTLSWCHELQSWKHLVRATNLGETRKSNNEGKMPVCKCSQDGTQSWGCWSLIRERTRQGLSDRSYSLNETKRSQILKEDHQGI